MIGRLADLARTRSALVGVVAIAVLLFGFVQLDSARVENLPEFNPTLVEVQTEALGLSAHEVEQLITVPLEADLLNGIAFVERIESRSMPGLSSVVMTFESGTDVFDARQLVQERLTQAAGLPNVSRAPAMVQPLSSESRVLMIGLSSADISLVDLGVLARWTIRPKLLSLEDVANVVVWGQREQQLQVQVDPAVLEANEVPLIDVVRTAGNALWVTPLSFLEASTPGVGGFIDGPNQRIGIRHVPAISTPEDLGSVAVQGRPDLLLGDVAEIVVDHQPLIGDAVVDGETGLYLVIEKFPWSGTAETTDAVEAALAELAPGLSGVQIDTDLFRPASYLDRAVGNIQFSAMLAVALIAAVFVLLLGSWRAALAAMLSILVAVGAAAVALMLLNATFNTMILLGLAIGSMIIIDDSVRNIEEMRRHSMSRLGVIAAVRANSSSLGYAMALLAVALVPALTMDGAAGAFIPSIWYGLVVSLIVAFIVSTLVAPAFASLLVGQSAPTASHAADGSEPTPDSATTARPVRSKLATMIREKYEPILATISRFPKRIAVGGLVLLALGAASVAMFDSRFVPQFEQTDIVMSFDASPGASLESNRRIVGDIVSELNALSGVEQAGGHVGRAVLSDQVANVNSAQVWVRLDPNSDYDATLDAARRVVDGYPGIGRPELSTYSNGRVDDVLRKPTEDLVVRVFGEEPVQLAALAADLLGSIGSVDGVVDARVLSPVAEPAIEIEVDLDQAAERLVKPGDVRRAAATFLSGIEVGSLFEDQKVFEVVVWSPPEVRSSTTSVENLLIDTPSGDKVRLGDVASVKIAPNEQVIERDSVSRYIDVVADVPSRNVGDVQDEITELVEASGLPYEYSVGFIEDSIDAADNQRRFMLVAAAVAVAMFLLLQAALSSFLLAAIAAACALAALSGSAVAVLIAGGDFSVGSFAGFVAIGGLTLRSSVGLLQRYEALQLHEHSTLDADAVAEGAGRHLWPTAVSAAAIAAACLAFVPFSSGAGREVLQPFAVAVLGGIITTTVVALTLLPAMYLAMARPARRPELDLEDHDSIEHPEYNSSLRTQS